MSLKAVCALFGAIGAHAIVSNLPDDHKPDPEDAGPEGLAEEWEFVRRSQDVAMFLANALDPTNKGHWTWPAGFEALEQSAAVVASGPTGGLASKLLPILESVGAPALTQLLQSLVSKPTASAPASALPPLGS